MATGVSVVATALRGGTVASAGLAADPADLDPEVSVVPGPEAIADPAPEATVALGPRVALLESPGTPRVARAVMDAMVRVAAPGGPTSVPNP